MEKNGINLLLVEDEDFLASAGIKLLNAYGYSVVHMDSGLKAIDYLSSGKKVHAVLMDINLGNAPDGIDTADIILKDRDIPIIFMSSESDRETIKRTEALMTYGFILKGTPFPLIDNLIKVALRLFNTKSCCNKLLQ